MKKRGEGKGGKKKRGETEYRRSKKMALGFYISFYGSVWQMLHAREN